MVAVDALDHTLTGTSVHVPTVSSDLEVLPDSSRLLLDTSTTGSVPVIQVRRIDDDSLDLVDEWPLWIKRFDISH